ncbi:MAG: hypothetical protein JWP31_2604 [Aeromicrobium sp.]|nr:hypothetical protein [Aeromicrobium sp.]
MAREQKAGTSDPYAVADREGAKRDRTVSADDRRHSGEDRHASSDDRIRAAVEIANLVADGLTGAHQRAPGLAELRREVARARQTGQSFVLAFLDVDGLKDINDTRGHAAGDDVLKEVVATVKETVREYDLVIRYGGDEFICGLLDVGLDEAANRFANTSKSLAGRAVAFSVGLAVLEDDDTLEDLIDRADRAMYEQRANRPVAGA